MYGTESLRKCSFVSFAVIVLTQGKFCLAMVTRDWYYHLLWRHVCSVYRVWTDFVHHQFNDELLCFSNSMQKVKSIFTATNLKITAKKPSFDVKLVHGCHIKAVIWIKIIMHTGNMHFRWWSYSVFTHNLNWKIQIWNASSMLSSTFQEFKYNKKCTF